jgi:hypothetical protein
VVRLRGRTGSYASLRLFVIVVVLLPTCGQGRVHREVALAESVHRWSAGLPKVRVRPRSAPSRRAQCVISSTVRLCSTSKICACFNVHSAGMYPLRT